MILLVCMQCLRMTRQRFRCQPRQLSLHDSRRLERVRGPQRITARQYALYDNEGVAAQLLRLCQPLFVETLTGMRARVYALQAGHKPDVDTVRNPGPDKRMQCISFRSSRSIAFAAVEPQQAPGEDADALAQ